MSDLERHKRITRHLRRAPEDEISFDHVESTRQEGDAFITEATETSYFVAGRRVDKPEDIVGICAFHDPHDLFRPSRCGHLTEKTARDCARCARLVCTAHATKRDEDWVCQACTRTITLQNTINLLILPITFIGTTLKHLLFTTEEADDQ